MRYLKKYNEELKASTYKSAADKLKKYGHTTRSNTLMNKYNEVVPVETFNKWQADVEKYSKYGTIKVKISPPQGGLGFTDSNNLEPTIMDFYFKLNFWADNFNDNFVALDSDNYLNINIPLEVLIIPKNAEDFETTSSLLHVDDPVCRLFEFSIELKLRLDDWSVTSTTFFIKSDDFDSKFSLFDRASAGRLRIILKKIFSDRDFDFPSANKNDYNETLYEELSRVIFSENQVSVDCGMRIEDIGDYINANLNANSLFQN